MPTFKIPDLREEDRARRWRAAFGVPGKCPDCGGTGKRMFYSLDTILETVDCHTCMGTGKGDK